MIFHAGIRTAALWNGKARRWVNGRKEQAGRLQRLGGETAVQRIWFHCSSLGEFEQGRPVLELIKTRYPGSEVVLTFFSPSGYEIRKDYKLADHVLYLPPESAGNAKKFIDAVGPSLVIFVKYDYWYHYLQICKKRNIPLLMISAVYRDGQPFFRWYGGLHRKMLSFFTHLFVQDDHSRNLLHSIGITGVTVAGDTRLDRVLSIAGKSEPIRELEGLPGGKKILVAGSTWPADEQLISRATANISDLMWIIAPHEIDPGHLDELKNRFPDSVVFSELAGYRKTGKIPGILIIDNIGMLSRLYGYADLCYVGGGFNKGIHNILEASVYHKPVIFGPRYKKFREAHDLIAKKAAFPVQEHHELGSLISKLLQNEAGCRDLAENGARQYFQENKGATDVILRYIQVNRLLTSS